MMKKRIISAAILPLLIASLAACSSTTSSVAPTTDAPTTSETPTSETPSSSEEPEPEPAPEPAVESITAADLHTAEILPNYVVSLTVRVDKILDTEESVKGSFLAADPFDGAPIVVAHSSLDASVLELTDKEDGTYKGTFDKSSDKLGLSITVGEGDAAVTTKVEAGDIVTITGVATIVAGVDGKSCIGLNGVIDAASIQKSEFLTYRHKVNVSVVDEAGAPVEGIDVGYYVYPDLEKKDFLTENGYILWGKEGAFYLINNTGSAIDFNSTTAYAVSYDGSVKSLSKRDYVVDGQGFPAYSFKGAAYMDIVVNVKFYDYSAPLTEALNSNFADGAVSAGSGYGARKDVKLGNMVYDFSVCSYQTGWGTKGIAVGSNKKSISNFGEIDASLKAPVATQLGEEKAASLTMKRDLTNVTSLTVNVLPEYTNNKGELKNAGEGRYCTAFLLESTDGGTTWALVSTREASASKKNTTTVWTYTPEAAVAKARYAVVVRMDYKKSGNLADNRFCITSITSTMAA